MQKGGSAGGLGYKEREGGLGMQHEGWDRIKFMTRLLRVAKLPTLRQVRKMQQVYKRN